MIDVSDAIAIGLLILGAYLAGCVLGYAARKALRRRSHRAPLRPAIPQPVAATRSPARRLAAIADQPMPSPAAVIASRQRPAELPGPRPGGADDLKQIKGIGKKTESSLNDLGIYHFDQIAAWTPANIDWLEGRIAIKGRIAREQWVQQAVLFATATRAA